MYGDVRDTYTIMVVYCTVHIDLFQRYLFDLLPLVSYNKAADGTIIFLFSKWHCSSRCLPSSFGKIKVTVQAQRTSPEVMSRHFKDYCRL